MFSNKLYLEVPYAEKDLAKTFGAKWDANLKKWYYDGEFDNDSILKLAKWIASGREVAYIGLDRVFFVESERECFKCKKRTKLLDWRLMSFLF